MQKKLYVDKNALRELQKFSENIQITFEALFIILREKGRLEYPEAKKIDKNLFELRVKHRGQYRGFYAYVGKTYIVILCFFRKKAQRTPIRFIKVAKRRLTKYE